MIIGKEYSIIFLMLTLPLLASEFQQEQWQQALATVHDSGELDQLVEDHVRGKQYALRYFDVAAKYQDYSQSKKANEHKTTGLKMIKAAFNEGRNITFILTSLKVCHPTYFNDVLGMLKTSFPDKLASIEAYVNEAQKYTVENRCQVVSSNTDSTTDNDDQQNDKTETEAGNGKDKGKGFLKKFLPKPKREFTLPLPSAAQRYDFLTRLLSEVKSAKTLADNVNGSINTPYIDILVSAVFVNQELRTYDNLLLEIEENHKWLNQLQAFIEEQNSIPNTDIKSIVAQRKALKMLMKDYEKLYRTSLEAYELYYEVIRANYRPEGVTADSGLMKPPPIKDPIFITEEFDFFEQPLPLIEIPGMKRIGLDWDNYKDLATLKGAAFEGKKNRNSDSAKAKLDQMTRHYSEIASSLFQIRLYGLLIRDHSKLRKHYESRDKLLERFETKCQALIEHLDNNKSKIKDVSGLKKKLGTLNSWASKQRKEGGIIGTYFTKLPSEKKQREQLYNALAMWNDDMRTVLVTIRPKWGLYYRNAIIDQKLEK